MLRPALDVKRDKDRQLILRETGMECYWSTPKIRRASVVEQLSLCQRW